MALAVFLVGHMRRGGVKTVHLHVGRFVHGGQASGGARVHQVAGHFGLAIHHHLFAAGEFFQVHPVAFAVEQHVKAGVHQAFAVHARTHAGFVQQVGGHLFQHAGPYAAQHIVGALAFNDDGVDAGLVQQLSEQQARGAGADDGDLGTQDLSPVVWQQGATLGAAPGFAQTEVSQFARSAAPLCDHRALCTTHPSPRRT